MNFTGNGFVIFDDIYEMYYNLFTTIGLAVNQNQYLYDQDNGNIIRFKDKYIKATVQPVTIYAGRNDILFEPARNYQLIIALLGYYIDKNAEEIGFIAQYIDEDKVMEKQRLCIKTKKGLVQSHFYKNIYLGYIECIFILSGDYMVDLSNFDFDIV